MTAGVLARSGFFVINPTSGGPTEKVPAVKAAGFRYLALNARDHRGKAWDDWRVAAAKVELPRVVWGRVYDGRRDNTYAGAVAEGTIDGLYETAQEWGAAGVALNLEDEIEYAITPERINELTRDWRCSLAILTDYRGYHAPDGTFKGPDYSCLADRFTGLIEAFDNTATQAWPVTGCRIRLAEMGFTRRIPLLGANVGISKYHLLPRQTRAVYALDTVPTAEIAKWAP